MPELDFPRLDRGIHGAFSNRMNLDCERAASVGVRLRCPQAGAFGAMGPAVKPRGAGLNC